MEGRQCGECTLCCSLLPVATLDKPAGQRCRHQRSVLDAKGPGCAVHHKKSFPAECGLWSCRWLVNEDMDDMPRPDQAHYVVDIVPDFITATNPGVKDAHVPIIQIWIDPKFPDAHRDPRLRAWLVRLKDYAALVRYDEGEALFLLPPHMSDTGEWEEIGPNRTNVHPTRHSAEEIAAKLQQAGIKMV